MIPPTNDIHILYVEDDPEFADATATFLEREDDRFTVETAPDASRGFQRVTEADIDCVVSDFDMPGQNGLELLEEVREAYPNLPFILFTGKGSEAVASEAISVGVTDYMQKQDSPEQYTLLANRIQHAVSERESFRAVERERHRSEQLLEAVPASVLQVDADCRFVFASERAREMLELADEQPPNQTREDLEWTLLEMDGEQVSEADRPFRKVWRSGSPRYDLRHIVEWPDGRRKIFSINGVPLFDRNDEIDSVILSFADITDLVEHERELEATETRLADHVETLRRLYEISADPEASFEQKLDRLLELGVESLGTETGIFASIEPAENRWEIVRTAGTDERIDVGMEAPLSQTYCRVVVDSGELFQLARAGRQGWAGEPAYQNWGHETYIGSGVYCGDELYGTLCFVDREGRESPFPEEARTFVELATEWLSSALEQRRHAHELERYREYTDELLDALDDVFFVVDAEGKVRRWNERLSAVTGYSEAGIAEMSASDFFADENHPDVDAAIAEVLQQGHTRIQLPILTRYGESIPHEFVTVRVTNPEGETMLGGIGRDITERRRRQRELERERDRYTTLFEHLPNPVMHGKMEGDRAIVLDINEAFQETFGVTPEEARREDLHELIVPDEQRPEVDVEAINRQLREEGELQMEAIRQTAEGPRDFRVDVTLRNPEAEVPDGYAIYTDITDRKEHERERQQRYEAIFDHSYQFAGLMEPDGTLLETNWSSLEVAGLDEQDVLGKPFWETPWWQIDEETPEKIRRAVERAARGEFVRDELRARSEDGTILVDFSIRPVTDDDGEVRYLIPEGRDITELRALERRERELARQNERLDRFARVVSHDLRNPLNIASIKLQLADRECDSEHLADVARMHDRMADLIDDVLTLTREGKSVENIQHVDLADVVETVGRDIPTDRASIDIRTDATILADGTRLRRLLENLFHNAVEYGGQVVTITVGDLPDGFYVEDDGVGIPEEHREEVFEAGYTSGDEGTGFGLSIVREIAEAHDWSVRATESPQGGARFEFTGVRRPPRS
jgi:PAS domain S-box-containing protein